MLPLPSRSSVEAPNVISRRSTRYRRTRFGLMIAGPGEEGGWPLAPCPGETTSMTEGHGLSVVLHGCVAAQGNFAMLSLLRSIADDPIFGC